MSKLILLSFLEDEFEQLDNILDKFISRKYVVFEREQYKIFCREDLDNDELVAIVGTYLSKIYLNIEGMLLRILDEYEKFSSNSGSWHKDLLLTAKANTQWRGSIISKDLYKSLDRYRRLSHIINKNYPADINYDNLSALVRDLWDTVSMLKRDLNEFVENIPDL